MATSVPGNALPPGLSPYDKVLHFTTYGILAALLTRTLAGSNGRWRAALLAVAMALAFGAADEWHQRFVFGRRSELADWQADALGAVAGAFLFATYSRIRPLRPTTT